VFVLVLVSANVCFLLQPFYTRRWLILQHKSESTQMAGVCTYMDCNILEYSMVHCIVVHCITTNYLKKL